LYRPSRHKTAWRGKARVIAVGLRAQEVLEQFFTPDINDFLFVPRRRGPARGAGREPQDPAVEIPPGA
jgi:hypothetical protein